MPYYVIAPDGQKYGPADEDTLNVWIEQGRLTPDMMLEKDPEGVQVRASMVPGLKFLVQPTQPSQPTIQTPPSPGPSSPFSDAPRPSPFGQPSQPGGSPYASYPRTGGYTGTGVPPELQGGWNWGAFYFSWIWGLNHRAYLTLIALGLGLLQVPFAMASRDSGGSLFANFLSLVGLGLMIWFGIKGNQWAWESGRFATVEECKACQRTWAWWVLGFVLAGCVCGIVLFVVLGAAFFTAAQQVGGPRGF